MAEINEMNQMMSRGAMSDKERNMMTPEEEIILESLMKSDISMDTALDIMASNKVDSMNKLQQLRGETNQPVRPQEFGGLPKMMPPTAPQGQPMPTRGAMSQQDMMAYLASKANTTKNAMGNMLNAMGGATPMMQPQMRPTGIGTTSDAEMRALQNATQQSMMPPTNPMIKR